MKHGTKIQRLAKMHTKIGMSSEIEMNKNGLGLEFL